MWFSPFQWPFGLLIWAQCLVWALECLRTWQGGCTSFLAGPAQPSRADFQTGKWLLWLDGAPICQKPWLTITGINHIASRIKDQASPDCAHTLLCATYAWNNKNLRITSNTFVTPILLTTKKWDTSIWYNAHIFFHIMAIYLTIKHICIYLTLTDLGQKAILFVLLSAVTCDRKAKSLSGYYDSQLEAEEEGCQEPLLHI